MEKVIRLIPHKNDVLLNLSLRLLLNLSFDPELRKILGSVLPRLFTILKNKKHQDVVLKLLYHLSQDDKCKSQFFYSDAILYIRELIITCEKKRVPKELIALGVNLAANERNSEKICENDGLNRLFLRLLKTEDSLLAKMLRNISQHESTKKYFKVQSKN